LSVIACPLPARQRSRFGAPFASPLVDRRTFSLREFSRLLVYVHNIHQQGVCGSPQRSNGVEHFRSPHDVVILV
jgi:hypothetical protein